MNEMMKDLYQAITNRLFPIHCLRCDTEGDWVCKNCEHVINYRPAVWQDTDQPLIQTASVFSYEEKIPAAAIKTLKYHYATKVMRWISSAIDNWLEMGGAGLFLPNTIIVPVPLHKKRLVKRGFNQSHLIAEALAKPLELVIEPLLVRRVHTKPQITLGRAERLLNTQYAFSINKKVAFPPLDTPLLVVDDVFTTGSTIKSCAQTLSNAGFKNISSFSLARER